MSRLKFERYGVVSLYDLLNFQAKHFVQLANFMREMEALGKVAVATNSDHHADPADLARVSGLSDIMHKMSVAHGLPLTGKKAKRVCERIEREGSLSMKEIHILLKDLRERFEDELEDQRFLQLGRNDAELYETPTQGWVEILIRFPLLLHNVKECSKCFALERYGAAVFHVMLVAEYGIIQVATLLNCADPLKPGWNDLERIQRISDKAYKDKSAKERKHSEFIRNFLPLAHTVKDSWRHRLSHVDKQMEWMYTDFDERTANEIITATKGMMRRLSSDLPRSKNDRQAELRSSVAHNPLSIESGAKAQDGGG